MRYLNTYLKLLTLTDMKSHKKHLYISLKKQNTSFFNKNLMLFYNTAHVWELAKYSETAN